MYVAEQIWTFFNLMRPRNLVVAYGKSSILDIGIITGPPKHLANSTPDIFANRIPVKWFRIGQKLLSKRQRYSLCYPQDTLHRIKDEATLQLIKRALPSRKLSRQDTQSRPIIAGMIRFYRYSFSEPLNSRTPAPASARCSPSALWRGDTGACNPKSFSPGLSRGGHARNLLYRRPRP